MANVIKIMYFPITLKNTSHIQGLYMHVLGSHTVKGQCAVVKNAQKHQKAMLLSWTESNKTKETVSE